MKREDFLKKSVRTGICLCGAVLGFKTGLLGKSISNPLIEKNSDDPNLGADLGRRMQKGSESTDAIKAEKSQRWIKNLIDHLDELLDEKTKIKLLNACGRSCALDAYGVADEEKPSPEQAEKILKAYKSAGYKIEEQGDKTIIYYGWQGKQNPWGLSLSEGFCLCPIMESNVPGLSPSYCNCSAGYVKAGIERSTGRTVEKVEILESLKMGGKDCRFKVTLLKT